MSSKTRTRTTQTTRTSGTTPTLRSVSDQSAAANARMDTEDKLWTTLRAHSNSTAADLASTAKIGKSTAQKILARWAGDGLVTRTAGITHGGRRAADLWALTASDTDPAETTTASADTARTVADTPAETNDATPHTDENADLTLPATDSSQDPNDAEETTSATAEPVAQASVPADADNGADGKAERLAPGALRGMVEDFLRNNPAQEFGPTAIAKALGGKSSGAVSNALDKLVETKTAVQTKESPKRFALAPAEADIAP